MSPSLMFVTYFCIIILIGILSKYLAEKTKIPAIFYLVIFGMILGIIKQNGTYLISVTPVLLTSIGIVALSVIIFDSSSRLPLKEFDSLGFEAAKFIGISTILSIGLVSIFSYFLFNFDNYLFALVLSSLLIGTSPETVSHLFENLNRKKTLVNFLQIESIINSPLTIIIPFLLIEIQKMGSGSILEYIGPFLQQIIVGIGAGVVIGILFFRNMRYSFSETISPLILFTSAILTYVLAENLAGNGILAVTTLGIFFGNMYVKQRKTLFEFSNFFSNLLEIVIFILLGMILRVDQVNFVLILKSLFVYIFYLVIRGLSVYILYHKRVPKFDLIFLSLNAPKGITTAIAAFTIISIYPIYEKITTVVLFVIFFSLITSTISGFIQKKKMNNDDKKKSKIKDNDNSNLVKKDANVN